VLAGRAQEPAVRRKSHRESSLFLSRYAMHHPARCRFPKGEPIGPAASEQLAVWGETQGTEARFRLPQPGQLFSGAWIPQAKHGLAALAGFAASAQELAVRRESHRDGGLTMRIQTAQLLGRCYVPKLDVRVHTACGQHLTIGREGNRIENRGFRHAQAAWVIAFVPQVDGLAARGERPAVG